MRRPQKVVIKNNYNNFSISSLTDKEFRRHHSLLSQERVEHKTTEHQ